MCLLTDMLIDFVLALQLPFFLRGVLSELPLDVTTGTGSFVHSGHSFLPGSSWKNPKPHRQRGVSRNANRTKLHSVLQDMPRL